MRVNTKLENLLKGSAAVGVTGGLGYVALSTTTPLIGLLVIAIIALGTIAIVVLTAARAKDPGCREAARSTLQTLLDFVLLLARRDPSTVRQDAVHHPETTARSPMATVSTATPRTPARRPRPRTRRPRPGSRPSTVAG